MAKSFYTTKVNQVDHRTFGGIINQSDFDTNYASKSNGERGSVIANRIMSDRNFDKMCQRNITNSQKYKKYNWDK